MRSHSSRLCGHVPVSVVDLEEDLETGTLWQHSDRKSLGTIEHGDA
jgi:hypothetical protein